MLVKFSARDVKRFVRAAARGCGMHDLPHRHIGRATVVRRDTAAGCCDLRHVPRRPSHRRRHLSHAAAFLGAFATRFGAEAAMIVLRRMLFAFGGTNY